MEELMKTCSNCNREIPAANFTIHEVHCFSRLTVCPKCKNSVPRTELQDHLESFHKEVSCENCNDKVELNQLQSHKAEICRKRLVNCCYCEIEAPVSDMQEHENYCGSRTELCKDCGQYVMLRDQAVHEVSSHSTVGRNKSNDEASSVVSDQILKDGDFNNVKVNKVKISNVAQDLMSRHSPIKRTNDMPQVNMDANGLTNKDSVKPSLRTNEQILSSADLDALLAFHLAESEMQNFESERFSDDLESFPGDDPLPLPFMNSMPFQSNASIGMPPLWDPMHFSALGNAFPPRAVPFHSTSTNTDTNLPCEFCGELFPDDFLIQHQSGCRPDIVHGVPQLIHSFQDNAVDRTFMPELIEDSHPISQQNTGTNDEVILLPCEFCGIHYPFDALIEHQNICEENPSSQEVSPVKEIGISSSGSQDVGRKDRKPVKKERSANVNFSELMQDPITDKFKNKKLHEDHLRSEEICPVKETEVSSTSNIIDGVNRKPVKKETKFPTDINYSALLHDPVAFKSLGKVPLKPSLPRSNIYQTLPSISSVRPDVLSKKYRPGTESATRNSPVNSERKYPMSYNVPIKLAPDHPLLKKKMEESLNYAGTNGFINGQYGNTDGEKESVNVKLFTKQARKEMNSQRDLRKTTGTRPKFQELRDSKIKQAEDYGSGRSALPGYIAKADTNVQAAYRNYKAKQSAGNFRLQNCPAQQRPGNVSTLDAESLNLPSGETAGAVPKNRVSKTPTE